MAASRRVPPRLPTRAPAGAEAAVAAGDGADATSGAEASSRATGGGTAASIAAGRLGRRSRGRRRREHFLRAATGAGGRTRGDAARGASACAPQQALRSGVAQAAEAAPRAGPAARRTRSMQPHRLVRAVQRSQQAPPPRRSATGEPPSPPGQSRRGATHQRVRPQWRPAMPAAWRAPACRIAARARSETSTPRRRGSAHVDGASMRWSRTSSSSSGGLRAGHCIAGPHRAGGCASRRRPASRRPRPTPAALGCTAVQHRP